MLLFIVLIANWHTFGEIIIFFHYYYYFEWHQNLFNRSIAQLTEKHIIPSINFNSTSALSFPLSRRDAIPVMYYVQKEIDSHELRQLKMITIENTAQIQNLIMHYVTLRYDYLQMIIKFNWNENTSNYCIIPMDTAGFLEHRHYSHLTISPAMLMMEDWSINIILCAYSLAAISYNDHNSIINIVSFECICNDFVPDSTVLFYE